MQGRVAMNMALRNTVSMLQMDLANAGSYFFQATNMGYGALGVTLLNNVQASTSGSGCYTPPTGGSVVGTYGTNCFDQLNIISVDSSYPVVQATDSTGATNITNCSHTSTGIAYGQLPVGQTWAATAGAYSIGDQLLFLQNNPLGSTTGSAIYTSVVLTAVPTLYPNSTSPVAVKFTFNPTNAYAGSTSAGSNTVAHDPLGITTCGGTTPCPPPSVCNNVTPCPVSTVAVPNNNFLSEQFCAAPQAQGGGDWILKLNPITYKVVNGPPDIAANQNPILTRTAKVNGVTTTTTLMEQVIGFKVGGSVWHDPTLATNGSDITYYNYDASCYTLTVGTPCPNGGDHAYSFSFLDSVRVSLIARTTPIYTKNYLYQNTFDQGPYQVQGAAVVVNPRNMSFNSN
jgi:hypothetical protein